MEKLLKEVKKITKVKSSKISETRNGHQIEIETEPISIEVSHKIMDIAISNKKAHSISMREGKIRFYDAPKEVLVEE